MAQLEVIIEQITLLWGKLPFHRDAVKRPKNTTRFIISLSINNSSWISKKHQTTSFVERSWIRTGYLEVVLRSVDPDVVGRDPLADEMQPQDSGSSGWISQSGLKFGSVKKSNLLSVCHVGNTSTVNSLLTNFFCSTVPLASAGWVPSATIMLCIVHGNAFDVDSAKPNIFSGKNLEMLCIEPGAFGCGVQILPLCNYPPSLHKNLVWLPQH